MTIALGLVGTDGVVLAADTEESYGEMKNETTKILTAFGNGSDACAISGAGNSAYLTSLGGKLAQVFLSDKNLTEPPLLQAFENCTKTFYSDHIIPFVNFPDEERPEVRMLIAYHRRNVSRLLFSDLSVVAPEMRYKAVGIGSSYAENFLNRWWRPADTKSLEILAAYIAFAVKESIRYCGKHTQIVTVRSDEPISKVPMSTVTRWEEEFRSKWAKAEGDSLWKRITQSVSQKSKPEQ
jgi:20S proteasome alpha/beta subunit